MPIAASSPSVAELLGPLVGLMPFPSFNKIQTHVGPCLLTGDSNVVVSAPTGSGKTLLLELAIMRLFRAELLATIGSAASSSSSSSFPASFGLPEELAEPPQPHPSSALRKKAVYICPIKALAYEKFNIWTLNLIGCVQV
jgi:ATP-dependent DNA helicase HFM1/MER3